MNSCYRSDYTFNIVWVFIVCFHDQILWKPLSSKWIGHIVRIGTLSIGKMRTERHLGRGAKGLEASSTEDAFPS